ncbi:Methylated-DNA--protein-cysteine methyltransferase, constitutive [Tautonia plasticadhaerens]|uniref:methylated-DNA--[protein]-cysteine S-methyltransferase n=2 Tax=Tautonia plasticadhaerens TaxID=2527974 RepID=A0A518HBL6_9BACT|nr:Methylated-DNA--protein-cysteine methyltransferase, constitutive [Tautonia plasticadhaerens]
MPPATGAAPNRTAEALITRRIETPLGPMVAGATDEGLALLEFAEPDRLGPQLDAARKAIGCRAEEGDHPLLARLAGELFEYFEGTRAEFSVPLRLAGSPFQVMAWQALRDIPFGRTRTYAEQARAIGRPAAVRAVGAANGRNRLAIVVPCHRVVASGGRLCGYGGGLWRKQFLIDLERRHAPGDDAQAGLLFS